MNGKPCIAGLSALRGQDGSRNFLSKFPVELHQLEYLVTVVEEANFTRAAERLHLAQPGVSAQVRRLERELGHTLLDRSTRTVRVTEAGAVVLPHRSTSPTDLRRFTATTPASKLPSLSTT